MSAVESLYPRYGLTISSFGDMYTMRDRLLNETTASLRGDVNPDRKSVHKQISDAAELAAAMAKLEVAEEQIRDLQARVIAEKVARDQLERTSGMSDESMRDCKNELAGAVRALRRAREEGKKAEEERKALARCFEETKAQ